MKCNAFSEELKNTYLFSIFKNSYFNISISKNIIYLKFKKKKKCKNIFYRFFVQTCKYCVELICDRHMFVAQFGRAGLGRREILISHQANRLCTGPF